MVVIIACALANGRRESSVMEKPAAVNREQKQQQWAVLKCPRCESSNTKFCYYNNYSLSQPRHFCKACKRYWTRGGTLRNVPVGGGCRRKNKRVKRPSCSETVIDSVSAPTNPRPMAQPQITNNPLFYGVPANRSDVNDLQFSDTLPGFDHLNGLGLGGPFSSGFSFANQITLQDAVSTSISLLPSYNSISSLLLNGNETLKQPRQVTSQFQTLPPPFPNQLQQDNGEFSISAMKMKVEGDKNRMQDWINITNQVGILDPSLYWTPTTVNSAWLDPANAGSSQSSL